MRERTEDDSTESEAEAFVPPPAMAFAPGFEPVMDDVPLAPATAGGDEDERSAFGLVPEDMEPADDAEGRDAPRWEAPGNDDEPPVEDEEPPARRYSPSPQLAEIFVINPAAGRASPATSLDRLDRLVKDIAEITQARETLLAEGAPLRAPASPQPAVSQRPTRTADSVPIILGGVIGFLMMTVIAIAALFTNFAR